MIGAIAQRQSKSFISFRSVVRVHLALLFLCCGCQHYCENYIECDTNAKIYRKEIAELKSELARARVFAVEMNEARCEDMRH